jgi:hypothetical protein
MMQLSVNSENSEDEIVKSYIENEKKRYLVQARQNEQVIGQKYLAKQIVKRVTIEGEHTYMLLIKTAANQSLSEVQLIPIYNCPH